MASFKEIDTSLMPYSVWRDGAIPSIRVPTFWLHRGADQHYTWRQRFAGMSADDVKRLRLLEQENTRLKKILAERDLEIEVMKEIAVKKW
jgi:putative transposase